MPAYYAHYRFGKEVSSKLTKVQLKEVISKYYPQFAMGLQGPDPFFFYKPYSIFLYYRFIVVQSYVL